MTTITATEFAALEGSPTLIDVREPDETAQVRIEGATLIPMSVFGDHVDDLPDDTIYLICHSGMRSGRIAQFLEQQGRDVVNVEGGITAWQEQGLPVIRG